ncbi:MAG: hypothetical protein SOZ90_04230 [Candidatus Faecousia sp.]|nr:hypothetical protein [Candidatus Faecousia sp.]
MANTTNAAAPDMEAAEIKPEEKTVANRPEEKTVANRPEMEIVELFIDRDPSDQNPNLVIGINGKNWVMPRGETSHVPKFVADEYKRAREAQYNADKTINELRGIKMA